MGSISSARSFRAAGLMATSKRSGARSVPSYLVPFQSEDAGNVIGRWDPGSLRGEFSGGLVSGRTGRRLFSDTPHSDAMRLPSSLRRRVQIRVLMDNSLTGLLERARANTRAGSLALRS